MKRTFFVSLFTGFVGASVALFIFYAFESPLWPKPHPPKTESVSMIPTARTIQPLFTPEGLALDFTTAAANSLDAVVHVKTRATQTVRLNPWLEMFGYGAPESIAQGSGSGVIIADDGFIVTNNHVIDQADEIMVSLNDNTMHKAQVVGTDPATDLALLKIQPERPLPSIEFGNSEDLQVGEWVLAVGNPFDLTSTVTAGIVSAKARNINILRGDAQREIFPVESFIQTDAAVNPGNSGGALVNASGQLVGINTAIASKTGSYSGYSFAVPVSIVRKVSEDLMAYGRVQRGFLGVRIGEMNQELAEQVGMPAVRGVYVHELTQEGGAGDAGMRVGDVILKINEVPVNSVPELQEQVSKFRPGERTKVLCYRASQYREIEVELRDVNGSTRIIDRSQAEWHDLLGAQLVATTPEDNPTAEALNQGVRVVRLRQGNLLEAGIREGFVITQLNGDPVDSPKEVIETFMDADGGVLVEGMYPNGRKAYYGVDAQKK